MLETLDELLLKKSLIGGGFWARVWIGLGHATVIVICSHEAVEILSRSLVFRQDTSRNFGQITLCFEILSYLVDQT